MNRTVINQVTTDNVSFCKWLALKRAVWFRSVAHSSILLALAALLATGTARFLWQKDGLDIRQHTTLGNGHTGQQLVQLLVVSDGQLKMARDDPGFLVVAGSVASQLQNLGGEVLHDGGQINRCASSYSLSVVSFTKMAVNTTHWKLKTSAGRSALRLSLGFSSFSATRHSAAFSSLYFGG